MKPVAVLRNDLQVPPGHLGDVLDERGIDWVLVRLDAGDAVPTVRDVSGVVALGGHMGVYDEAAFPYLDAEKGLLASATAEGLPVLGICLGCQLLAESLGGAAYRGPVPEAYLGVLAVGQHPVVAPMGRSAVLSLHQDTWEVPQGGSVIASSDAYPQAFVFGTATGIQPHPEVDARIVRTWLKTPSAAALVRAAGQDPDRLIAAMAAADGAYRDLAWEVFGAWVDGSYPS